MKKLWKNSKPSCLRSRLHIEPLEERRMLSVGFQIHPGYYVAKVTGFRDMGVCWISWPTSAMDTAHSSDQYTCTINWQNTTGSGSFVDTNPTRQNCPFTGFGDEPGWYDQYYIENVGTWKISYTVYDVTANISNTASVTVGVTVPYPVYGPTTWNSSDLPESPEFNCDGTGGVFNLGGNASNDQMLVLSATPGTSNSFIDGTSNGLGYSSLDTPFYQGCVLNQPAATVGDPVTDTAPARVQYGTPAGLPGPSQYSNTTQGAIGMGYFLFWLFVAACGSPNPGNLDSGNVPLQPVDSDAENVGTSTTWNISADIDGGGPFVNECANEVTTLSGNNGFDGLSVQAGTVIIAGSQAFGSQGDLDVSGGTLDMGGYSQTVNNLYGFGTGDSSLNTVFTANSNYTDSGASGLITNNGSSAVNLTIAQNQILDAYYGNIEDGSSSVKLTLNSQYAGSELLLDPPSQNSYSGGTVIKSGMLVAASNYAVPVNKSLVIGANGVFVFDPTQSIRNGSVGDDDSGSGSGTPTTPVTTTTTPLAVNSVATVGSSTTSASMVQFQVTYNQPVTNVTTANFSLVSVGQGGDGSAAAASLAQGPAGTISSVTGSGASYTVTVTNIYGAGTLGLAVRGSTPASNQAYTIQSATGPAAIAAGGQSLQEIDPDLYDTVLTDYTADGSITRNDMIGILESADGGGSVSDQALAGLQAITQPGAASLLGEKDYVAALAADVVQGNQANGYYQGTYLGNLASQPTDALRATALTDLVGKWFEGTDLPAAAGTYAPQTVSLFGTAGTPSSADMHQGQVGDCYFIAAMGAIADTNPQAIENAFINNGDGTYTVRFYTVSGTPDYVTVNSELPVNSSGSLIYCGVGSDGAYWLPLLEKAYAQWNETGNEFRDGINGYADISGGFMGNVDQQVLGVDPIAAANETAMINALAADDAVTVACYTTDTTLQLVADHAYEVSSYNSSTGLFTLENPWGDYEPEALTWAQLSTDCSLFTIAT